MEEVKITLKRSFIGRCEKHKKILRSLGLKRPNQSVIQKNTPSLKGMIYKVSHLVEVEQVKRSKPSKIETHINKLEK